MFERPCLPHSDCLRELAWPQWDSVAAGESPVSKGLFWKVCAAHINYLEISWFLHYPLTVWSHIFPGCNQGGKVTFGNTLSVADPGGGGAGGPPPLLGHDVGFLALGPKLDPPPFFACRPKMDPPPFQTSWIRPWLCRPTFDEWPPA